MVTSVVQFVFCGVASATRFTRKHAPPVASPSQSLSDNFAATRLCSHGMELSRL